MTVETDDDLLDYLDDFGVFFIVSGVPEPVKGIFDNGYAKSYDISSSDPSVIFRASDVPNIRAGDSLTKQDNGMLYEAKPNPEPDGSGFVIARLKLQ